VIHIQSIQAVKIARVAGTANRIKPTAKSVVISTLSVTGAMIGDRILYRTTVCGLSTVF